MFLDEGIRLLLDPAFGPSGHAPNDLGLWRRADLEVADVSGLLTRSPSKHAAVASGSSSSSSFITLRFDPARGDNTLFSDRTSAISLDGASA